MNTTAKFDYLQAQMDGKLAEMQSEMVRKYKATGKSTNGLVHVVVDADHFIKKIKIDDSVETQNLQQLNQWIQEATNDAIIQVNLELERRSASIIFDFLAKGAKILEK